MKKATDSKDFPKLPLKMKRTLEKYGFGTDGINVQSPQGSTLGTNLSLDAFNLGANVLAQGAIHGLDVLTDPSKFRQANQVNLPINNAGGYMFDLGGVMPTGDTTKTKNGKVPPYDPTLAPTYDPNLLINGKFLVNKPDGSIGQWGNSISNGTQPLPPVANGKVIPISDKAAGYSNSYYTPGQNRSTPTPNTIHASSSYALGTPPTGMPGANAEVEGNEVAQTPNGQVMQFQGPSHDDGGIDTNLPDGTKIYSDRLSMDGKTMQERKIDREKKLAKMDKYLKKNPGDILAKNGFDRMKQGIDQQDQQDLQLQQQAQQTYNTQNNQNPIQGNPPQGSPTGMNPMQDPSQMGGDPNDPSQQFAYGGIKGYYDLGTTGSYPGQIMTPEQMSAMLDPLANGKIYTLPNATPAPYSGTNPATLPYAKISPAYDAQDPNNVNMPNGSKPNTAINKPLTTGDNMGLLGNVEGAIAPLATTIANRAGDKPNINPYQNFGNNAINDVNSAMGYTAGLRDKALTDAQLQSQTQKANNRGSATSINTIRGLDLATDANTTQSNNNIYANWANQMSGLFTHKATLDNQKDYYIGMGTNEQDQNDRADRDSYYNNLGKNFANISQLTQKTGKDLNEHQQNNDFLNILPELSKYGLGFTYDANGNPVLSKVKGN